MPATPGCIPRFNVRPDSASEQTLGEARQTEILAALEQAGAVVLDGVYPKERIEELRTDFFDRYHEFFGRDDHEDALTVGHKRVMVSVEVADIWAKTDIHANPLIYPLMDAIFGRGFIINGFNAVVSFPGSKNQDLHRDYPGLFNGYKRDYDLPCFAISMFVPLVDMTAETGCTRLYPFTHKKRYSDDAIYGEAEVPQGSVMLVDYRLYHHGMANKSDHPRPLLTTVYSRPWFYDHANYRQQEPVFIKESVRDSISKHHRHLFRLIRHFKPEDQEDVLQASGAWASLLGETGRR